MALLAVVTLLCPSCATALLWSWAGQQRAETARLVGVASDDQGDVLVYDFESSELGPAGRRGIRIARQWWSLPTIALARSTQGEALALMQPFAPIADVSIGPIGRAPRSIDYRETIGRMKVSFGRDEYPYGVVELIDEQGVIVHELYGYDHDRAQWIMLASMPVGSLGTDAGRMAAGVILTPVTLAVDVLALIGIAAAARGGGSVGSLDFPSFDGGAIPVSYAERERYWRGLAGAPGPAR